jgi:tetratricopeptide (TPR) repeat protein
VTRLRTRRGSPPTAPPHVTPGEPKPNLLALVEEWVRTRFGLRGIVVLAVLLALGFVWWNWEEIKNKHWISSIVEWSEERPVPPAALGKFAVAVAHLDNDPNGDMERLVVEAIEEFPGVQVLRFDRRVALDHDARDEALRQAHENARSLLRGSGADVLIWGTVLKADGQSLPKLRWTTAAEVGLQRYSGRYQTTEDLNLPPLFWDDLVEVLRLVVARHGAEFAASEGQFVADRLRPFIDRVRTLLVHAHWSPEALAEVSNALGIALVTLGRQAADTQALGEAIVLFQAVEEHTRERASLDWAVDWAVIQNNLGIALLSLGEHESGTERLEEAVAVMRAALEAKTRERAPLDWALTQNNLGAALETLGERGLGTKLLEESVAACRAALEERTRERVPLDWAGTQRSLGVALSRLGERESGLGERESSTERLEEAVAVIRAALEENTRERVPLEWASTQANLGNALSMLGERESSTERLEEAVAAYRAALEERTRERVPLDWAATQTNLGNALLMLGELESGTERLEEAVAVIRAALEETRRDRVPLDWALTQNNLGNALLSLGAREQGTERLEDAVATFRAAFEVLRVTRAGHYRRMVADNLHRALSALEARRRPKP